MYARSTTMQVEPQAIDRLIGYVRDAMPMLERMGGYVGNSLLCDRETGTCIATTTWDTHEAMRASADDMAASRTQAMQMTGAPQPEVQEWEVAAMHRVRETPEGACARLIWARGEHGQMDRILEAWRTTIPPQLEQMPGFCAVSALVNRDTMRAVAAVSYESREAMDRSADQGLAIRDKFAATMQFEITDVEEYDVVLARLRIPEMA
jgi:heme-degrading monooxygenase HmoA